MLIGEKLLCIRKSLHDIVKILIEMVTGKNQPYDHLFFKKYLIPFSANGDLNDMIQNDIFITFFKHLLKYLLKRYSTVSETFISFRLTNVEFRKSCDFFVWILRGSSVGFAWN